MPGSDILEGALGAFVQVVALSNRKSDFLRSIDLIMREYGLSVIEVTDVELISERLKSRFIAQDLMALADTLSDSSPILLDEIHTYLDY